MPGEGPVHLGLLLWLIRRTVDTALSWVWEANTLVPVKATYTLGAGLDTDTTIGGFDIVRGDVGMARK